MEVKGIANRMKFPMHILCDLFTFLCTYAFSNGLYNLFDLKETFKYSYKLIEEILRIKKINQM